MNVNIAADDDECPMCLQRSLTVRQAFKSAHFGKTHDIIIQLHVCVVVIATHAILDNLRHNLACQVRSTAFSSSF